MDETLKYLNLAVKLEQNSFRFYKTARDKVKDFNMKSLLNSLMGQEVAHLSLVVRVRDLYAVKKTLRAKKEAGMLKIHKPKNPFSGMIQTDPLLKPGADVFLAFKRAVELEQKAYEFYIEAAEHAEGAFIRNFLRKLAKDELNHKQFIESHREAVYNEGYWLGIDHVRLEM